ncbi:MAG: hypothetical protein Q8K75_11050 [Chlamydiales bacterium]|nr:hypothetical protein [Chlamydiales bacterium]
MVSLNDIKPELVVVGAVGTGIALAVATGVAIWNYRQNPLRVEESKRVSTAVTGGVITLATSAVWAVAYAEMSNGKTPLIAMLLTFASWSALKVYQPEWLQPQRP